MQWNFEKFLLDARRRGGRPVPAAHRADRPRGARRDRGPAPPLTRRGERAARLASVPVADADLRFWFDPVCPFAWMTSKWVRTVAAQRDYRVEWRFISLRLLNAAVDYDAQFPPGYEAGHTAGLRLLRVSPRGP